LNAFYAQSGGVSGRRLNDVGTAAGTADAAGQAPRKAGGWHRVDAGPHLHILFNPNRQLLGRRPDEIEPPSVVVAGFLPSCAPARVSCECFAAITAALSGNQGLGSAIAVCDGPAGPLDWNA